MSAKTLGPRQADTARHSAVSVEMYATDLQAALAAGDLDKVTRLTTAMRSHLDGIDALVKRASATKEG